MTAPHGSIANNAQLRALEVIFSAIERLTCLDRFSCAYLTVEIVEKYCPISCLEMSYDEIYSIIHNDRIARQQQI
jgi:hypothetical protein